MLNNKIDYVGNRANRPGQLERASLINGLSNTLGDLQTNMESIESKIKARDDNKPINPEFLATEKELSEQDAKSTALLAQHIGKLEHALGALGDKVQSLSVRNEDAMDKAMEAGNYCRFIYLFFLRTLSVIWYLLVFWKFFDHKRFEEI